MTTSTSTNETQAAAKFAVRPPLGAEVIGHPGVVPPRTKRPVLYLDFDGVLHHEDVYQAPKRGIFIKEPGFSLFQWSDILEDALAPHPSVAVVLSTSWVRVKGFNFALRKLPPSVQARVVGATFHRRWHEPIEFQAGSRGMQIWADVQRRLPPDWVALDDDDFGWPAWCRDKLVCTPGDKGLSCPRVQQQLTAALVRLSASVQPG